MEKRKFPLINVALLSAIVIIFITINKPGAPPDEQNCSYIIGGEVIELTGGRSDIEIVEGAASRQLTDFIISKGGGDLNLDGRGDSVVFLRQSSGGSGTFYYAAAALGSPKGCRGTNAVFLGDRIEPLDISFDEDIIIITYRGRADGESFSEKPSLERMMRLQIKDGTLVEVF
ncbi:MAG: hypothetical protein JEZ04_12570 [Spirochaetales bacterium]|nr:hypothetical protein [Spirochaetales bacterium]